jgi:hypothetical protein
MALKAKYGELSVMEEALVSRVSCCTSVLSLPNGGQLGYRGSVINFVNELATVAQQLPRAPKDTGIIVYVVRGQSKDGKAYHDLVRIRKKAVEDHLTFFATHHQLYIEGIINPDCHDPASPDYYRVKPFSISDIDQATLGRLPDDGVPNDDELEIRVLKEHEACGADDTAPPRLDACSDCSGGDTDDDEPPPPRRTLEERELRNRVVVERVLAQWLRDGTGQLAQSFRVHLTSSRAVDVHSEAGLEEALMVLHGVSHTEPRNSNGFTIATLARRLESSFSIGTAAINVDRLALELRDVVRSIQLELQCSGLPHNSIASESSDPIDRLRDELEAILAGGNGTASRPNELPVRGTVPICEYRTKGYATLAFPTLFPFGCGDISEVRAHPLSWKVWSRHLQKYYDGRFAMHQRFPYFLLNTHERDAANRQAGLFLNAGDVRLTVGDLKKLNAASRQQLAQKLSKYGATLRNTPAFFTERRRELNAMCDEIGDPNVRTAAFKCDAQCTVVPTSCLHASDVTLQFESLQVFATNSHADTYCPYLAKFIQTWADIPPESPRNPDVENKIAISDTERYERRAANVNSYPHIVATFFHLKTELYVEHICKGIMGADAYWMRYEWQSRGSTHVHYFLWLKGAPDLSYLDEWVRTTSVAMFGNDAALDDSKVDALVVELNERATSAVCPCESTSATGCACAVVAKCDPVCGCHAAETCNENECSCDCRAARDAAWWSTRSCRWSDAWEADRPMQAVSAKHPSSLHHPEWEDVPADNASADLSAIRNKVNRHFRHTPYCQRRDPKSKLMTCRFKMPLTPKELNKPHLYCERVKNGIRCGAQSCPRPLRKYISSPRTTTRSYITTTHYHTPPHNTTHNQKAPPHITARSYIATTHHHTLIYHHHTPPHAHISSPHAHISSSHAHISRHHTLPHAHISPRPLRNIPLPHSLPHTGSAPQLATIPSDQRPVHEHDQQVSNGVSTIELRLHTAGRSSLCAGVFHQVCEIETPL